MGKGLPFVHAPQVQGPPAEPLERSCFRLEVLWVGCDARAWCVGVKACQCMFSCVHILSGVKARSHQFFFQTRMETTFGPAFSAVTTITKGEPVSQASPARIWAALTLPVPVGPFLVAWGVGAGIGKRAAQFSSPASPPPRQLGSWDLQPYSLCFRSGHSVLLPQQTPSPSLWYLAHHLSREGCPNFPSTLCTPVPCHSDSHSSLPRVPSSLQVWVWGLCGHGQGIRSALGMLPQVWSHRCGSSDVCSRRS